MKQGVPIRVFWVLSLSLIMNSCKGSSEKLSSLSTCVQNVFFPPESDEGPTVIRVDGIPITLAECKDMLNSRAANAPPSTWNREQAQRLILDKLVGQKILVSLARKAGMDNDLDYRLNVR